MKYLILAMSLLSMVAYADNGEGGNSTGNGGGGVKKNGRYMTFYSAGIYTNPSPEVEREIPNLRKLTDFVHGMNGLTARSKSDLISALIPTANREYYRVQKDKFDKTTRDRIIKEFSNVTGAPSDQIEIFALTDTNKRRTFLLPSFYDLNPTEQMAILFHEAYWILNPQANYEKVVSAEVSFQAMLEHPGSNDYILDFLRYFGSREDQFTLAYNNDLSNKSLVPVFGKAGKISLSAFLGNEYVSCLEAGSSSCYTFLSSHAYRLSSSNPSSMVLKLLLDRVSEVTKDEYYRDTTKLGAAMWASGWTNEENLGSLSKHSYYSSYRTGNDVFGHSSHSIHVIWSGCVVELKHYSTMGNPLAYGLPVTCNYSGGGKVLNAFLRF